MTEREMLVQIGQTIQARIDEIDRNQIVVDVVLKQLQSGGEGDIVNAVRKAGQREVRDEAVNNTSECLNQTIRGFQSLGALGSTEK